MQNHNAHPDPSTDSPVAYGNGAAGTPVAASEPYVHPTIPLGLPHVVQFVEASMHHLPMSVRFVGDRMSRYANAKGEVSIAIPFICQITGLGSKNTAEHHIRLMESLGVLEKRSGKGGKDRKSNTYIFLGEQRSWKPLPHGAARHRPLDSPGAGPPGERGTQGRDRPAPGEPGHRSLRSDRWGRGGAARTPLPQLRNRRFRPRRRGSWSHRSLRSDRWLGGCTPGRKLSQLRSNCFQNPCPSLSRPPVNRQ